LTWSALAAIFLGLAVTLGAFGAPNLQDGVDCRLAAARVGDRQVVAALGSSAW
jgi:uncharacterized membrane protein YgdD (TMEM256/DUF423 family)